MPYTVHCLLKKRVLSDSIKMHEKNSILKLLVPITDSMRLYCEIVTQTSCYLFPAVLLQWSPTVQRLVVIRPCRFDLYETELHTHTNPMLLITSDQELKQKYFSVRLTEWILLTSARVCAGAVRLLQLWVHTSVPPAISFPLFTVAFPPILIEIW